MLASRAEILSYLGQTAASEAEIGRIEMLARLVQGTIRKHLGYRAEQGTHTEYLPAEDLRPTSDDPEPIDWESVGGRAVGYTLGTHSGRLQLRELPVRSITTLYEDTGAVGGQSGDDFPASSQLVLGRDFYLDVDGTGLCASGLVVRRYGGWSTRPRTIKVTYTAGYSDAELAGDDSATVDASPIKFAFLEAMKESYTQLQTSSVIASERLADYSVSYVQGANNTRLSGRVKGLLAPFVRLAR